MLPLLVHFAMVPLWILCQHIASLSNVFHRAGWVLRRSCRVLVVALRPFFSHSFFPILASIPCACAPKSKDVLLAHPLCYSPDPPPPIVLPKIQSV